MIRQRHCPGIARTVYSRIFRDIDAYLATPRHYSTSKTLHLKCLTVFWIHLCLNNCSVICTVILCYVLHQKHSEFWHIQNSAFSDIFTHNEALLSHIQVYSCICRTLSIIQNVISYWKRYHSGIIQPCSGIQACSKPCVTLAYVETWNIWNPEPYLHPNAYLKRYHIYENR